MNKAFVSLIILLGLLLALNAGGAGLLGLFVFLFIIGSAFSVLLHKKPVSYFIGVLLGLIIGPVIVCCILRRLFAALHGTLGAGPGNLSTALLLLLLMTACFLYVRRRILGGTKHESKELQTNEQRPMLPPANESEDSTGSYHARD
ncbi:MAG TPA: hypothetical protein VNO70_08530 [Blastocatellia bacterium]|nr:hypothetical protein [Blastocatellia bacterium]